MTSSMLDLGGRLAVVSHTLPPAPGGQAVMINRLLVEDQLPVPVLICSDRRSVAPQGAKGKDWFSVHTQWALRRLRTNRSLQRFVFHADVWFRSRAIANIVRRSQCSAIIACTGGDLVDLPAAVEAGVRTRVPVFLHYFDDYRYQWRIPNPAWCNEVASSLCEPIEQRVLAATAGIIVPNEILAEEVRQRVSASVAVVRNPVDTEFYARLRNTTGQRVGTSINEEIQVLYTGAVYEAQGESLLRCAQVIETLQRAGRKIRLHIYTPDSADRLRQQNVPASTVIHPSVTADEAAALQCRASVLLLPLSFETRYPELIRTSAPGKMGEYLASGRPLLVHAPTDSFPAYFAKSHDCAAVCDTPDSESLMRTLVRILDDEAWSSRIATRSLVASEQFSIPLNCQSYKQFIASQTQRFRQDSRGRRGHHPG